MPLVEEEARQETSKHHRKVCLLLNRLSETTLEEERDINLTASGENDVCGSQQNQISKKVQFSVVEESLMDQYINILPQQLED